MALVRQIIVRLYSGWVASYGPDFVETTTDSLYTEDGAVLTTETGISIDA